MALTHTPAGRGAVLDPTDAPRRMPKQTRTSAPVLGVTAMAAALGATTGLTAAAAAAEPAAPAPAVTAPDTDPGLALAARIQQQAEPAQSEAQQTAQQPTVRQETARQEAEQAARAEAAREAARLEAAHEAAAKRAAQQAAAEHVAAQQAVEQAAAQQSAVEQAAAEPAAVEPTGTGSTVLPIADRPIDPPVATPWEGLRTGVDFSAPVNTPVRAVAGGTVSSAGWSGRYGYRVIQTLPDGTEVWYCQLSAITATAGELAPGEPLGRVGATGSGTTVARLHLEVRPGGGAPVDAAAWFQSRGV
ncbi:M23 family metallopeptidase [Kitasatospora viridis]|uniref:Murein DD-endopeptidase MepM/ murein hydrolase activator NlpD n=1 Tax=Kitasatospora viridis TaxID=281105 RepID=A0A561UGN9_9ACTN|nr:M23 family metallopeptidase [Kitasatospora viridis]TWF98532.1 murein DD-endopeptidase MepM/ murein hydrolase activator NlpD [Kitasatospora viridis]